MDARSCGAVRLALPLTPCALVSQSAWRILSAWLACVAAVRSDAAGYRTPNFVVNAPTAELAREVGDSAEQWRKQLAMEWIGEEMPRWAHPCPITVSVAPRMPAGGATSFVFDRGEVFDWRMNIQGSRERILDSVLPHEITHTIFACHFRRPLPRWADEGACTTVEHQSEIAKQERLLIEVLQTRRGIAIDHLMAMKEYPPDVLPLYAQGYALAEFLIGQRGKAAFLKFLHDGLEDENWPRAVREHYGYDHLLTLQNSWLDWIRAGRPELAPSDGVTLASATTAAPSATARRGASGGAAPVIRGQDPESMEHADNASPAADGQWRAVAATGSPTPGASPVSANSPTPRNPFEASSTAATATNPYGAPIYDASRQGATAWR